ncbi:hypothetical protein M1M86_02555 [Dehalococcoidales bacterium]|nr:hypothetical protein [Dehalococcoidales bacterium]
MSLLLSSENIDNMEKFFQSLARDDFLFAWEPRRQWDKQIITSLCHQLELIHCVDPLEQAPLYGTTNYFRLHGGPGYRHSYSNQELEYLRQMTANKESYVLFNNITMYDDALRFTNLFLEK